MTTGTRAGGRRQRRLATAWASQSPVFARLGSSRQLALQARAQLDQSAGGQCGALATEAARWPFTSRARMGGQMPNYGGQFGDVQRPMVNQNMMNMNSMNSMNGMNSMGPMGPMTSMGPGPMNGMGPGPMGQGMQGKMGMQMQQGMIPNGMYVRGMNPSMMGGRAAPYPSPAMHMAQKRAGQFPGAMPAQYGGAQYGAAHPQMAQRGAANQYGQYPVQQPLPSQFPPNQPGKRVGGPPMTSLVEL
ncbi:hypothetical protein FJT64_009723 [Amphibalanus amphitrite]|uniref:Uncharacterized protein n=1 Tax=Amphibalanus amphitrite TaxID=1232801 RepID=A0A6A4VSI1_AMPAM|nr:hypothetical protein FJT64_009723 [Amphibalanus amphitrite]